MWQNVSFGVDNVITLRASPVNQSIEIEIEKECEKYRCIVSESMLWQIAPSAFIVHTYIMNGEYKLIGLCLCKWLNFDLLKLKDYSDWKRFMGFNHYIYKSSFSPPAAAVAFVTTQLNVCFTLCWRFFFSLLILWTSVFSCYVGNTSYSHVLNNTFSFSRSKFSWSLRPYAMVMVVCIIRKRIKKYFFKYNSKRESNIDTEV